MFVTCDQCASLDYFHVKIWYSELGKLNFSKNFPTFPVNRFLDMSQNCDVRRYDCTLHCAPGACISFLAFDTPQRLILTFSEKK